MSRTGHADPVNLEDLRTKVAEELDGLRSLDEGTLRAKNEDVTGMIRYYHSLTNSVEDRRVRIHTFSLQLLAISAAVLAVLISGSAGIRPTDFIFWPLMAIVGVLVVTSLVSSIVYEAQSGFRYPFLKLEEYGNQWKWFYYGNEEILKMNPNPIFRPGEPGRSHGPYLAGLLTFVSSYTREDLREEITDNVQQLYLLQVHNYYKNRFYLQLTRIWRSAMYAIAAILALAVVAAAIVTAARLAVPLIMSRP